MLLHSPSRLGAVAASALALIVTLGSCSSDKSTSPSIALQAYLSKVTNSDGTISATAHAGAPPAAGSGPTITVTGNSSLITGGTSFRTITGGSAFNHVIVAIDGIDGYYDLTLPSNVSAADILLSIAPTVPQQTFTIAYAAGASGSFGAPQTEPVTVLSVGTGDVQVSVSWDKESDTDLHLLEPGGEEIYYGNDSSAAGGVLDLDSNAGCSIDGVKNENITYPTSAPPRGTYTVRVDYWDSCGVDTTKYVVTVRVKGKLPQTFTGFFVGAGDQGSLGDGRQITTFTY